MRKPSTPATNQAVVGRLAESSAACAQIAPTRCADICVPARTHTSSCHGKSGRWTAVRLSAAVYGQPDQAPTLTALMERTPTESCQAARLSAMQRRWLWRLQRGTNGLVFGSAAGSTCAGDRVEHNSDLNFIQSAKVSTAFRLCFSGAASVFRST